MSGEMFSCTHGYRSVVGNEGGAAFSGGAALPKMLDPVVGVPN